MSSKVFVGIIDENPIARETLSALCEIEFGATCLAAASIPAFLELIKSKVPI